MIIGKFITKKNINLNLIFINNHSLHYNFDVVIRYLVIISLSSVYMISCIGGHSFFRKANIADHQFFSTATIHKSDRSPFQFCFSNTNIQSQLTRWKDTISPKNKKLNWNEFMQQSHTVAFIVIRNDSILYENYFNGMHRDSLIGVFSITKSIVGLLAGIALDRGLIKELHEPIHYYIPSYSQDDRRYITWYHLLNMSSGFNFNDYENFGKIINLYYSDNLDNIITQVNMKFPAGLEFIYKSFDTQVLGYCLEKVYGESLTHVLQRELWQPLHTAHNAYWNLDRYLGTPKFFGGLNMCPIDLAKIGKLMLQEGQYDNKQVVSQSWISHCKNNEINKGKSYKYGYGWWKDISPDPLIVKSSKDYYAAGLRGQMLYICPEKNIIIIRQGTAKGGVNWYHKAQQLTNLL